MTTNYPELPGDPSPVSLHRHPSFEGCNVGTWIGFKHIFYLAEEGVLHYLRQRSLSVGMLLEEHALGVELVDMRLRLVKAIQPDDLVQVEVRPLTKPQDREMSFAVTLSRGEGEARQKLASGKATVALRAAAPIEHTAPAGLARFVTSEISRDPQEGAVAAAPFKPRSSEPGAIQEEIARHLVPPGSNAFLWKWRIPYFYCHYTHRIQHSGYVRLLEEVVDRFLADRGISIATMLRERSWIPVVLSAEIQVLKEALMEEDLQIVYTVEDITREIMYTARMDCYVLRDEGLVQVATARIVHAYCYIEDRGVGATVMPFDERVMRAFKGPQAP